MSERTYPRNAWVLAPSFKPVEVELIKPYGSNYHDYGDLTAASKLYAPSEMHDSKALAIAAGWALVEKQQAKLDKMALTLGKKRAALTKASKE